MHLTYDTEMQKNSFLANLLIVETLTLLFCKNSLENMGEVLS